MTKYYPYLKEEKYTYSNQLINLDSIMLWFEEAVPQLHTFHMDLHTPTHVQLKIPTVYVWDMFCLSVMKFCR